MTRKLEELFDLPSSDNPEEPTVLTPEETRVQIAEIDATIDKIDAALPMVKELETSDKELDEIADMAKNSYQDLTDLGFNVDSRFSAEIFSVASTMLGHALSAKTAKLNKKLKMIQLQLQKARLDHQISKDQKDPAEQAIEGQGMVLDRNELLKHILGKSQKEQ